MNIPPHNLPFLFAAFAVVWIVFFAYAGYMSWKRQAVQREMQDFSEELQAQPPAQSDDANSQPPDDSVLL